MIDRIAHGKLHDPTLTGKKKGRPVSSDGRAAPKKVAKDSGNAAEVPRELYTASTAEGAGAMRNATIPNPGTPVTAEATPLDVAARLLDDTKLEPKALWVFDTGSGTDYEVTKPSIGPDGTLYVGCANYRVYAIKDGKEAWKYQTGASIYSTPCIGGDGTVYAGSGDGKLHVINGGKRKKALAMSEFHETVSAASGAGDLICAGSSHGALRVLKDGRTLWKYDFKGEENDYSEPLLAPDGAVYLGSNEGRVHVLKDGKKISTIEVGDAYLVAGCLGPEGTLYARDTTTLYAIKDGKTLWKHDPKGDIGGNPCADNDGTIFLPVDGGITQDRGRLCAVKDGKELWSCELEGSLNSTPALGPDGTIYVCSSKKLYAIRDGKQLWSFKVKGGLHADPRLGPDGTVFVGSKDGKLHAVANPLSVTSALKRAASGDDPVPSKPDVQQVEDWLIVGGLKLPVKKDQ